MRRRPSSSRSTTASPPQLARLAVVRRRFAEQFQKARESVTVQQERALISDLGDNAKLAGVAIQLAVKRTLELLAEGRVQDPSRIARDLSDVQAKAIDKSRLLQDKPTVIVAKPKMAEIISGLESLGVIEADARTRRIRRSSPLSVPIASSLRTCVTLRHSGGVAKSWTGRAAGVALTGR
jgi:hypothetical protein